MYLSVYAIMSYKNNGNFVFSYKNYIHSFDFNLLLHIVYKTNVEVVIYSIHI